MKFTNGHWVNRENVKNTDIMQVREVKITEDKVWLYCVSYGEDRRGLGGPVIEMFISSPCDNIIRMEAYHFMGSNQIEPKFDIKDEKCKLEVKEVDDLLIIKSKDTKLVIEKREANFTYYYKNRQLTNLAKRFDNTMLSVVDTPEQRYMRAQLQVDIGEKIYGLGERFTPYVKNGQVVDIWNEDGGTTSQTAYKNIPFYITNRNYGVFVNSTDAVSYEICSEHVTKVQFSIPGEKLDFMVIGGEDMKDVLVNYTNLTGKPALPPAWSFGLWLTSSFTTSYDDDTVLSFVNGMKDRDIPLHVFHFDCFWMRENEWCNFTWDRDVFKDPEALLYKLKLEYNLKICVWINSYIGQKSYLFQEAKELGYLLKKPNGDVWQWDIWQAGLAVVDFTNPQAYKWFQDKLRILVHQGVDSFKTDFGERIPTDVVYYDGSDPVLMHNYYTYLYNKCVFEVLEEEKGVDKACLFARSATATCQQFPVHWGGDCSSTYDSMSESLRGGLSLCMSGFSFWSHDISGFEGKATNDVYKRWAAFGLLSTHSRLHGSKTYRVPWLFGEEAVDVVRYFTKLKCTLMPYLFSNAIYSTKTGIPLMRSMILEFQKDLCCEDLDRQYMLGDCLLVAPVFKESGEVTYYLPKGIWTHFITGEEYQGEKFITETYGYMSLPVFVKENSIIALGKEETKVEYDYVKGVTLTIFQLTSTANCKVYSDKGKLELEVCAMKDVDKTKITFSGNTKNVKILMKNVSGIEEVIGASVEHQGVSTLLHLNPNVKEVMF